jgi:hypothetical protein
MSDDANSFLSGYVNEQHFWYLSCENPRLLHEKPQTSKKFVVWCAIGTFGIIVPDFFAVTVNAD